MLNSWSDNPKSLPYVNLVLTSALSLQNVFFILLACLTILGVGRMQHDILVKRTVINRSSVKDFMFI